MASYQLLTFVGENGDPTPGLLVDGNVLDLGAEVEAYGGGSFSAQSIDAVLDSWESAEPILRAIAESPDGGTARPLGQVKLLQPINRPGAIYCAAANYYDHAEEMGNTGLDKSKIEPYFFIKSSSCVTGPGAEIRLPMHHSEKFDYEIEVAAIVGRTARHLTPENALGCLAGYTILNDMSARDHMKRTDWPFGSDWCNQKSFETSAPMGSWITPASAINDIQNLALKTTVNDDVRQNSSTSKMVFSVAEQIAHLSRQMTLKPGDVIATGTCAGVAAASGNFLKPGDQIHMEVEGITELSNPVVAG